MDKRKIELEQLIEKFNKQYWETGESEISDVEYDRLIEELRNIDPNHELLEKLYTPITTKQVVHKNPMLSLAKVYSFEELLKWCIKVARNDKETFLIQPKYDGLSGKLENGILSSRGNGQIGEDYTEKLPLVSFEKETRNIHELIKIYKETPLLGEILIRNEDFEWMTKNNVERKSGGPFKNQRNAVSGIIGTDEAVEIYGKINERMKASKKQLLTFVSYDTNSWEIELKALKSQKQWDELKQQILELGYPLDGIVVKLKDKEYGATLGATPHHPKNAIAFKFTNQSAWSKLIGIEWTMGKDQIGAVGEIEPLNISGTTIRHVKLQVTKPKTSTSTSWLLDGSLQINDEVLVERAGDIIPHIIASRPGKDRKKVSLEKCPFCGSNLILENETSLKCTGKRCQKKMIEALKFAMISLGFKGVGESYAENLVKLLNVTTVKDLLSVTETDLRKHKEFGDKMVTIFMAEQSKAKKAGFQNTLKAMNIPGVGKNVAKLLEENFSRSDIINVRFTSSDLKKIKGIGAVGSNEIINGLTERKDELQIMFQNLDEFDLDKNESFELTGETICFTGKMSRPRGEMEKLAKENGYVPVDRVTKDTKILVVADPNSKSSKIENARKTGCKIISETEFLNSTIRS